MTEKPSQLSYAVRFPVILKYIGQVCLVAAALNLVPLAFAMAVGEGTIAQRYGVIIGGFILAGLILGRLRAPRDVQTNEGIVVASSFFLFTPLLGAYPMMGAGLGFLDAFFEAVSGVTTTGLSTLATVEGKPLAFLFGRAWMQWYGGLGIMALSLALIVRPGLPAMGLAATESVEDDLVGSTKNHTRRVLVVYSGLTLIGVGALLAAGIGPFDAVVYTLASVSTGGFAPHDESLAGLGGWHIHIIVLLVCLACAVSLTFYWNLYQKGRSRHIQGLQLRTLIAVGLVLSLLLGFSMGAGQEDWRQTVRHAPFMAFSAQTTTGFSTLETGQLSGISKLLLMGAMAVGGGVGSTAGGFKVLRLLIFFRLLEVIILRASLSRHAFLKPRLADKRLDENEIQDALLIILLFVGVIFVSWVLFVAMGMDPLNSLFEVVSATGTVGLSVGVTDAHLPGILKGVLCADMLAGRLEVMAWLVMISPATWLGRRRQT